MLPKVDKELVANLVVGVPFFECLRVVLLSLSHEREFVMLFLLERL